MNLSFNEIDEILKNVPGYTDYVGIRNVSRVIHCGDLILLNQSNCVYIGKITFYQDLASYVDQFSVIQPDGTTVIKYAVNLQTLTNGGGLTFVSPQNNGTNVTLQPSFTQYDIVASLFPVTSPSASFEGYMVQLK